VGEPAAGSGTADPRFEAVILLARGADVRLAGMTLLERAVFTAARAGARRVLCVGERPGKGLRLPELPVTWAAHGGDVIRGWLGGATSVLVGLSATTVVDTATVRMLASAPGSGLLTATGPGSLWRCEPCALPAVIAALVPAAPGSRERPQPLPPAVPWTPPPGGLFARADDEAGRRTVETALYARLGRSGDGWFTRLVDRRISRLLTRLLLPTGASPNQVTVASIGLGIIASLLFASGEARLQFGGALLFLLSTIVDGCDGEIARLTFRESRFGAHLDVVGDNLVHLFLFTGIAVGIHRQAPDGGIVALGALLLLGAALAMATVYWCLVRREPTRAQRWLFETFASREFAYVLVVLAATGKLVWFLWAAAIGTHVFVAGLLLLRHRPRVSARG